MACVSSTNLLSINPGRRPRLCVGDRRDDDDGGHRDAQEMSPQESPPILRPLAVSIFISISSHPWLTLPFRKPPLPGSDVIWDSFGPDSLSRFLPFCFRLHKCWSGSETLASIDLGFSSATILLLLPYDSIIQIGSIG